METDKLKRNIRDFYKVGDTIGKGGFATVKKGKNKITGEHVAVKIYKKYKLNDHEKESVDIEIQILRQLDHPNIIKLLDVFEEEKYLFLIIELMEGGEMSDLISERLKESDAKEVVKILVDVIRYCHQMGVLHRDIKPQNLLFPSKNRQILSFKLSDFGLAKKLDENQLTSTTCGTPGYLAPEILTQDNYGKECDYWSIGVITFELLSGCQPFNDDDRSQVFLKAINCNYQFDNSIWSEISQDAKDFISKLLIIDPKSRLDFEQMLNHPWISNQIKDE